MNPDPELPPHALAALVAVADAGSVSAAARLRSVTQPTLSRQIQELERLVGAQLLERSASGASLTLAGVAVASEARVVLARLAAIPGRARALAEEASGQVRFGCIDSFGIYVLPPVLAAFVRDHPRVQVQVVCQSSPQLVDQLLAGDLDAAVGTSEDTRLQVERLYLNPLVLVHRHDLPPERIPGTLAELARSPVISFTSGLNVARLLEQAFTRSGLEFRPVMELANVEMIKAMVLGGLGFGVIPDGCLPYGELAARPLPECAVARTIRLLLPARSPTPAASRLIERLRGLARP